MPDYLPDEEFDIDRASIVVEKSSKKELSKKDASDFIITICCFFVFIGAFLYLKDLLFSSNKDIDPNNPPNYPELTSTKGGFTLMKLLMLGAILSIVACIVFSYVLKTKERVYSIRAIQHVNETSRALTPYFVKHGSYPSTSEYGEANTSWLSWDTSTQDKNRNNINFIDPLQQEGFIAQTPSTMVGSTIFFNYAKASDPAGGCLLPKAAKAQYIIVAYNLKSANSLLKDSDCSEEKGLWNQLCTAELPSSNSYCLIKQ